MGERRMKIMIISDLHYDRRIFHGIDQSKAWSWLLDIVEHHRPNYLLSCGDWGTAVSVEGFEELKKKVQVFSIFGNHENMEVLESAGVLMEDGKVYEVGGLRVAGINGIISVSGRPKRGVPRKTPEEYLTVAEQLAKQRPIDVLLIHETPYLPELFPFMRDSVNSRAALKAIEMIKPKATFNGHMHYGGYKVYTFPWGTRYIYIDSSQQNRHYVILYTDDIMLEIWRDFDVIYSEAL